MPRPNYGPLAYQQTRRLFEALLAYANGALADCDHLQIEMSRDSARELVIHTRVKDLEALTALDAYSGKLTKNQIKEAIHRLKSFLSILVDNRPKTRGSDDWYFTLKLWYRRQDWKMNLQQFDAEWKQRLPPKLGPVMPADPIPNLDERVKELEAALDHAQRRIQELEGQLTQLQQSSQTQAVNVQVKDAAIKVLSKLHRISNLYLLYYDEVQPVFVKASEILAEAFDVIETRDFLWKQLHVIRRSATHKVFREDIETSHIDLCRHYPDFYKQFIDTIEKLKVEEEVVFRNFLEATQDSVLVFRTFGKTQYQTAMLGNALRMTCTTYKETLKLLIEQLLEPLDIFLVNLIQ